MKETLISSQPTVMVTPNIVFTNWEYVLGCSAAIATIFQFLSGALVCKQYVQNKTTGEASALPFLFGVLSCGVWYFYGVAKDDDTIVFVNSVGFVLMLGYVIVFYNFALRVKDLKRQILFCVAASIFIYGSLLHEEDIYRKQNILGSVACGLTLLTIAAPLVKLYHVIKVKSTECLPYHMILMSFVVSGLWTSYGFVKKDEFLLLPNVIGMVLAAFQLCLFLIYPDPPTSSVKTLVA